MMVNQEMEDESTWIWLTSEQMGWHFHVSFQVLPLIVATSKFEFAQ